MHPISVVDSQFGTLKFSSGVARPPNVFGAFELKLLHLVCKLPYRTTRCCLCVFLQDGRPMSLQATAQL